MDYLLFIIFKLSNGICNYGKRHILPNHGYNSLPT